MIDEQSESLSGDLIRYIRAKPVAQRDLDQAALFLLDAIASMIAGLHSPQGEVLMKWARTLGPQGQLDPGRQALLLGALSHILEMDDLHRASVVHPGCVTAPVIVALAGQSVAPQGHDLLKAFLHGFEACTRIGQAVGTKHYEIWHNTATCGPFGAAMAAADLLGLSDAQARDTFGNTGTQAAGLWQFLDTGAMSKHLHAGRAAEAGLVSAQMAKQGFTGAPQILEGTRGFFAAMCPNGTPDDVMADLDQDWQIHLTSIKPWPSCRHTHPAIGAARALRTALAARKVAPEMLDRIEIETYPAALDLCDRPDADGVYQAKFSLQHCVAAALALDEVDFSAFDQDARDQLSDMRGKVKVEAGGPFPRAYPDSWGSAVTVFWPDGALTEKCDDAFGDPGNALSRDEMVAKARGLMRFGGLEEPEPLIMALLALAQDHPFPVLPAQLP